MTPAPHRGLDDRRLGYRPELDGLRGIAILGVIVFHASEAWFPRFQADGGLFGVDLFFVLSGFLITSLLLQEKIETGRISRLNFYGRRMLRLLPALVLGLALGAILAHKLGGNGEGNLPYPQAAVASLLFLGNWFQLKLGSLAHMWSLAIEEQYYLVWPFVLVAAVRRKGPSVRLAAGIGAVALVVASARIVANHAIDSSESVLWQLVNPWARLDGVLIGSALAVALASAPARHLTRALHDRTLAAGAAVCAVSIGLFAHMAHPVTYDLLVLLNVCFMLLIGHVVTDRSGPIARLLRLPPLTGIGKISYGLYVFHWPLFFYTDHVIPDRLEAAVTGVVGTFVVAIASYFGIEKPALQLKSRLATQRRGKVDGVDPRRPARRRTAAARPRRRAPQRAAA